MDIGIVAWESTSKYLLSGLPLLLQLLQLLIVSIQLIPHYFFYLLVKLFLKGINLAYSLGHGLLRVILADLHIGFVPA